MYPSETAAILITIYIIWSILYSARGIYKFVYPGIENILANEPAMLSIFRKNKWKMLVIAAMIAGPIIGFIFIYFDILILLVRLDIYRLKLINWYLRNF